MDHVAIEAFADVFANTPRLAELEVRTPAHGTLRLRRSLQSAEKKPRSAATVGISVLPATTQGVVVPDALPPTPTVTVVESSLVGVFRAAVKVSVDIGSVVAVGQTLGAVEVMRLSSDVPAPVAGVVTALFVQDGQPVEYGQPLFAITPADLKELNDA